MIAGTISKLPVILTDIKREALKDDFIHTTKNTIYNKDPNVPEVFFTLRRCPFILSYLPNPSARAGYDTRSIFKRSLTGLNSEFSFS